MLRHRTLAAPVLVLTAPVLALAALLAVTGCAAFAPAPSETAAAQGLRGRDAVAPVPSGSAPPVVPEPGRTIEATAPTRPPVLDGLTLAVVIPDASPTTDALHDAALRFAASTGAVLQEFRADGPGGVDVAFAAAAASEPDLIVGLGAATIDVFSFETAQRLDQQFLLVGGQLAEPTGNVTAIVWDGATSRGSAASADGRLDEAPPAADLLDEAFAVGVTRVRDGETGVVLHLAR